METITLTIQFIATFFGSLSALATVSIAFRLHWPAPVLWLLKLFISALSNLFFLIGVFCVIIGLITESLFITSMGLFNSIFYFIYVIRVTQPPNGSRGFEIAFGFDWENRIRSEQKKHFLTSRRIIRLPVVPIPRIVKNIPFATIPGSSRKLLCDVWQPNANVSPSGLAFIYIHGSAWSLLDKDFCTRPFFSHLTAQGHVIMDVAYRLAPETDIMGMINDVKRAIIWMKEKASTYRVNPNNIVVGGGSAGGHLALMAAYTANKAQFATEEMMGKDLSLCGVVSLYGPTDLKAMYYHTNQQITTRPNPKDTKKPLQVQFPDWLKKRMGKIYYRFNFDKDFANAGVFAVLLGGHPDECPEKYTLFSPITHVNSNCPPTILIQGEHDLMSPVKATRFLYSCLVEKNVTAVLHILPQTDHAFDLVLPQISPTAHTAIYDVERFLALQVKHIDKQL